ncbi:MAG: helix-turn-helix domain-containing protein [Blastocatellia bacterium]
MNQIATSAVLTLEEAANYLKLPSETIGREATQGNIPGRQIANSWRFLKSAIDDWLWGRDNRTILLQQAGAMKRRSIRGRVAPDDLRMAGKARG